MHYLSNRKIAIGVFGLFALGVAFISHAQQSGSPTSVTPVDWGVMLPPGPGKEYVRSLCNRCHTVGLLMIQKRSGAQWRLFLEEMNAARQSGSDLCACRGGPLDAVEMDIISSYMGEAFGSRNAIRELPINVNAASLQALLLLPGIGRADAEKLIKYRRNRPF